MQKVRHEQSTKPDLEIDIQLYSGTIKQEILNKYYICLEI